MIACGMSGGMDSSVAAWMLREQGHEVLGIFMRNWDDGDPACRSELDRVDALRVCGQLGIPFRVMDFQGDYRAQVFQAFLDGYARGITPNPDILCNREVKFGVFLNAVLEQGIDTLATGHYARTAQVNGQSLLLRARDRNKDQSYFLSSVNSRALAHVRFPLGDLTKPEVRQLADAAGLATAGKKDSTGICFIGERDFRSFLASYLPAQPGPVVDEGGRVLGQHEGALYYTVGQRASVGGVKGRTKARGSSARSEWPPTRWWPCPALTTPPCSPRMPPPRFRTGWLETRRRIPLSARSRSTTAARPTRRS